MIRNPRVTIAIPVFNGANYLRHAIESAINQSYSNIEVIVVNDGSTDDGATEHIARQYGDQIKYIHQQNGGVGAAMNTAVSQMTGDIFTWLSHDDLHLQEKVAAQVDYWNRIGREDAILFSDFYLINEEGEIIHETKLPLDDYIKTPMLPLLRGQINGCTLFIPANIIRKFGPFDESLRYVQDYDLWHKILAEREFFFQPRPLVKYRIHSGQDTKRPEAALEGDALWIRMLDSRSETERVHVSGSTKRFFIQMDAFLQNTPYKKAALHARRRIAQVVDATLVSVVIPASEDLDALKRATRSVLGQTHQRLEIIIVHPCVESWLAPLGAIAREDTRIRLVACDGLSRGAALNSGMQAAAGEYIAFLDPDDLFDPCKITWQLRLMQHKGEVFSHTSYLVSARDRETNEGVAAVLNGHVYPEIFFAQPILISTVMLHRSLLSEGLAFHSEGSAAEILAWIWVALRHPVCGIVDALTVACEPEPARTRLERRCALLASLESDPVHGRATKALHKLRAAIADDEQEMRKVQDHACRILLTDAHDLLIENKNDAALAAVRQAVKISVARDTLEQAGHYLRNLEQYEESLDVFLQVGLSHGCHGLHSQLGLAFALVGKIDDAITMFAEHLRRFPEDRNSAYHLASCLAFRGRFEEAEDVFSRNLEIAIGNGGHTTTAMIRFSAPTILVEEILKPLGRCVTFQAPDAVEMDELDLVYFLSCDSTYAKLFAVAAIRSVEDHAGLRVCIHLHLINPDQECLDLISALRRTIRLSVLVSQETFEWPGATPAMLRSYYSASRFLVLPDVQRMYGKPILVADIDQLLVKSLTGLVASTEHYDIGLLYFPRQAHNLLSLFSASVVVVRPTPQGSAFASRVHDFLMAQLQGGEETLGWHIDQVALAVATLSAPSLRWYAIPPQFIQSEMHHQNPDGALRPDAVFWSVTYSVPENTRKIGSQQFQRYAVTSSRPKVLFVCFPYSIHAARWVSLLSDATIERHVLPSMLSNDLHTGFRDVTVWWPPGLSNPPAATPSVREGGFDLPLSAVRNRRGLAEYLARVVEQERFDIVHTMEFQHAAYLMLDALKKLKCAPPTWIVTNYGADIALFGKEREHEQQIRRVLSLCDYYWSECRRDVDLARALGFSGRVLPVVPNGGGIDLAEASRLRQPGPSSERRTIMVKGYQHFAGRALTALQALAICRDELSDYEVNVFAPSPEVRAEVERLAREEQLRIRCLEDWVSHEDILRLHGAARLSIAVSIADGISTSLLEAMAMGSFPIQTSTACAAEWIDNEVTGFIIPPDDPRTIAECIRTALRDDALIDAAAERNWQRIELSADHEKIQRLVQNAYFEILDHECRSSSNRHHAHL